MGQKRKASLMYIFLLLSFFVLAFVFFLHLKVTARFGWNIIPNSKSEKALDGLFLCFYSFFLCFNFQILNAWHLIEEKLNLFL